MLNRRSRSPQQQVSAPARLILPAAILTFTTVWALISCTPAPSAQGFPTEAPPTHPIETERPEPTAITFWTIAQEAPLGDHPAESFYAVVTDPDEWSKLQGHLPATAIEAGMQAGPGQDSLIIAGFGGAKGTSGHSLAVQSVVQAGDRVIVTISQDEPDPDAIREPAMTLPYHLVAVPFKALSRAPSLTIEFHDPEGLVLAHREVVLP